MRSCPPIVGIPCDHRMVGKHPFHIVGEKYIAAVRDGAVAIPLLRDRQSRIAGAFAAVIVIGEDSGTKAVHRLSTIRRAKLDRDLHVSDDSIQICRWPRAGAVRRTGRL